ncbi:nuclear factor 7, ovary-like [Salarias fasciatus]|uniref:Nuclear factor 7, ovary-like n=1 Tax=Salarias fasciatus TaxID=181472 RepID=A0A672H777_SALFA|nr:nuclear factor 7, ovary-like [Salarias fasciatus]XP_029963462.1 nuclear factor 7, ovary-like [Salarias fasciatus]
MASEEHFYCSICLDIFTDPVSTPCGHNYCKSCITDYWAISDVSQCPLCQETFLNTPKLRVNTEFRDILKIFRPAGPAAAGPGVSWEVSCDLCPKGKRPAVKSCLACLASYCDAHLQPHGTVQALQWHKLVDPVGSLEDRVCQNHSKVKELFCRTDRSCVCTLCMADQHATHEAVSLQEEVEARRSELKHLQGEVKRTLIRKSVLSHKIQNSVKRGRHDVEKAKAEILESFAALVALIESRKVKLLQLLEEKQKAAEQQGSESLRRLQQEIQDHQDSDNKLERLLKSEDEFTVLQGLPSIPAPSKSELLPSRALTPCHMEAVRKAMTRTTETLTEQMDSIMKDVKTEGGTEEEEMDSRTEEVFHDELGIIQQNFAEEVTLDRNTAHPSLLVSVDQRQVTDGGWKRSAPDHPSRFDCLHYVLANQGFSSGKFYYQASLRGQTSWEVGVARDSIGKKGVSLSLSPDHGCWTLGLYWGRIQANDNPPVVLFPSEVPQRVGVFVDYEGQLVSFYDVDRRTLLYSFTRCVFTPHEDVPSSSGDSWWGRPCVYTCSRPKTKVYPIFRPGAGPTPLQINTVRPTRGRV